MVHNPYREPEELPQYPDHIDQLISDIDAEVDHNKRLQLIAKLHLANMKKPND